MPLWWMGIFFLSGPNCWPTSEVDGTDMVVTQVRDICVSSRFGVRRPTIWNKLKDGRDGGGY